MQEHTLMNFLLLCHFLQSSITIDVIFDIANVFQIWSMLAGYDSLTKKDILFLNENTCMVVTLLL